LCDGRLQDFYSFVEPRVSAVEVTTGGNIGLRRLNFYVRDDTDADELSPVRVGIA
jgi:hypothetical protein